MRFTAAVQISVPKSLARSNKLALSRHSNLTVPRTKGWPVSFPFNFNNLHHLSLTPCSFAPHGSRFVRLETLLDPCFGSKI